MAVGRTLERTVLAWQVGCDGSRRWYTEDVTRPTFRRYTYAHEHASVLLVSRAVSSSWHAVVQFCMSAQFSRVLTIPT